MSPQLSHSDPRSNGGCRVQDLEAAPGAWPDCTRTGCPHQSRGEEQQNTPRGWTTSKAQSRPAHQEGNLGSRHAASFELSSNWGGFIDRSQVKYSFKDDKVEALFK